ncbi:gp8 baseplate wedge subunit [Aeromonas phage Aeh1]|uniref:Gp8 baseplate wedge subunit n=1 Tax=Aeromonas phage Aeh1 TaxID=2880362 RepID=Q76YM9_9CAUD|nr:baseplate wedge subunit [Aeromonas phage Aeh1]AAQ17867.1 gp8 baseplate wedge subunit [Aeromonas phage Aeh1]
MSSIIYRSIVTNKFRTENLLNFYNSVGDTQDKHTIYATFGRPDKWADNETDSKFAPPYPDDSIEGIADVWSRMLGAVKIQQELLRPVVPRDDWGDQRFTDPFIHHIGDIVVTNSAPYNRTEIGSGWMIYRCVDVPEVGQCSIKSIVEKGECMKIGGKWTPSRESLLPVGKSDGVDMKDGYIWEYLYTIPPDVAINECTNEHIVVPTPQELIASPSRWGYQHVLKWYPNKYDVIYRMKCHTLRFRAYIDSIYFKEASMVGNKGFRQLSVILDPILMKTNPASADVKATGANYLPTQLERHSGEMIYMENRQPIIRSRDQTEEFNLVFEF